MNKNERSEIGDIRINTRTKKREICVDMGCYANSDVKSEWVDYDTKLLEETWGQCSDCGQMSSLSAFHDVFMTSEEGLPHERDEIKLRYAYVDSPTTIRAHPAYHETLRFKVVSLSELEEAPDLMSLLSTFPTEYPIEVIGRDRWTGLKDITHEEIYENDIVSWHPDPIRDPQEDIVEYKGGRFYFGGYGITYVNTEIDSKVIGNKYRNTNWKKSKE